MDLSEFDRIDPHLLVGLVNTELRNHAASVEDLCRTHDVLEAALRARLAEHDYHYKPAQNQFR